MRAFLKTLLWVLAAIAPLGIAAIAVVRWDASQEQEAARSEARRSARTIARVVDLAMGVATRQLEALADSPALEMALEAGERRAAGEELGLFNRNPAWLGVILVGPDGETIASAGQVLASDLELVAPGSEGLAIRRRRGLDPPRAVLARPVEIGGRERAWVVGAYSLEQIEKAFRSMQDGGMLVLVRPEGTMLLGPPSALEGALQLDRSGTTLGATLDGEKLVAAAEPVLDGGATVVSVTQPEAFGSGIGGVLGTLFLATLLLAAIITGWQVRLARSERRLVVRERELGALQELATDATVTTNREQVIRMAGTRTAELLGGVDGAFIALTDSLPGTVLLHPIYPVPGPQVEVPMDGNLLLSRVLQHAHRETGRTDGVDPSWRAAGFDGARWESWTPLVAHGRVLGALACLSPHHRILDPDEERLLDGMAATLAVALESHERLSELSQQRATLATVVDASPEALLALDGDNRVILDNPAARALFRSAAPLVGIDLDQLTEQTRQRGGRLDFDFDPTRLLERSRSGITTRGSFTVSFGDERAALESLMAPLPLPAPMRGTGSLISMRDVSAREELEEVRQLHQRVSELAHKAAGRAALLEQVLAASDVGMVFLDAEERVAYANDLFGELLGIATPPRGLAAQELSRQLGERVAEGFRDLRTPGLLRTGPGGRVLAMRTVEVTDPDGRRVGRLVSLRDETAQRELEEARESFIGVAAHELKNPLAVLRIQAEVGLRDTARSQDALRRILLRAGQLQELVERLLDATRAELGKLNLERSKVHLFPLVCDAVEPFVAQGATVQVDGDAEVHVVADAMRLKQVVTNLVSNAVRYGGEGPVSVHVTGNRDGTVRIAVADRGPGIPLDEQRHIFERFGQGRSARRGPGLGIGLYLSQRIVQAHGGGILLQSAPGAGSTFTVVLPAEQTEATA